MLICAGTSRWSHHGLRLFHPTFMATSEASGRASPQHSSKSSRLPTPGFSTLKSQATGKKEDSKRLEQHGVGAHLATHRQIAGAGHYHAIHSRRSAHIGQRTRQKSGKQRLESSSELFHGPLGSQAKRRAMVSSHKHLSRWLRTRLHS